MNQISGIQNHNLSWNGQILHTKSYIKLEKSLENKKSQPARFLHIKSYIKLKTMSEIQDQRQTAVSCFFVSFNLPVTFPRIDPFCSRKVWCLTARRQDCYRCSGTASPLRSFCALTTTKATNHRKITNTIQNLFTKPYTISEIKCRERFIAQTNPAYIYHNHTNRVHITVLIKLSDTQANSSQGIPSSTIHNPYNWIK